MSASTDVVIVKFVVSPPDTMIAEMSNLLIKISCS